MAISKPESGEVTAASCESGEAMARKERLRSASDARCVGPDAAFEGGEERGVRGLTRETKCAGVAIIRGKDVHITASTPVAELASLHV
jgi:hypothetical protein